MTYTADPTPAPDEESAMWKPMTYAELILDERSHDMERDRDGIVHARSCWCAQTPAPSSSAGGATTSGEEQAHG